MHHDILGSPHVGKLHPSQRPNCARGQARRLRSSRQSRRNGHVSKNLSQSQQVGASSFVPGGDEVSSWREASSSIGARRRKRRIQDEEGIQIFGLVRESGEENLQIRILFAFAIGMAEITSFQCLCILSLLKRITDKQRKERQTGNHRTTLNSRS